VNDNSPFHLQTHLFRAGAWTQYRVDLGDNCDHSSFDVAGIEVTRCLRSDTMGMEDQTLPVQCM
jgi:hypothetical protein